MESKNLEFAQKYADPGTKEEVGVKSQSSMEIQSWLVSYLSEALEIDSNTIEVNIPFERYGLDSSAAVVLIGDMEDWIGFELDPTLLVDYPTIESLSDHLAKS